jgi:hypothetical protein
MSGREYFHFFPLVIPFLKDSERIRLEKEKQCIAWSSDQDRETPGGSNENRV